MSTLIRRIPLLRAVARWGYYNFVAPRRFPGSHAYWQARYRDGGTSGAGSYAGLAEFKAEVINDFVAAQEIRTVIEYGCGDGNQLAYAAYPAYLGFDISAEALDRCRERFAGDPTKRFALMDAYAGERAELALSLDVIYHLIEDEVYHAYMERLFDSATRFVIIYASDTARQPAVPAAHIRHRKFTAWVVAHRSAWHLVQCVPNRYPWTGDERVSSFCDFYIYGRQPDDAGPDPE